MIQKVIPACFCVALFAGPALAGNIEMVCQNPRQGYSVTFDDMDKTLLVSAPGSETFYMVKSVETGEDGLVVKGTTVKDGPDFVAHLGGKKRIEFTDGGQVFQTDPCQ